MNAQESLAVRPPAVAGTFYPDDAAALAGMVDSFLAAARHLVTGAARELGGFVARYLDGPLEQERSGSQRGSMWFQEGRRRVSPPARHRQRNHQIVVDDGAHRTVGLR